MLSTPEFEDKLKMLVVGMKPGEWKQVYRNTLGMSMYVTPCVDCGAPVKNWSKNKKHVFKCNDCREKDKDNEKQLSTQLSELSKYRRLEKAKHVIRSQYGNWSAYENEVEKIQGHFNKPRWFQSTNEILAALELMRLKVKARHQVKMGKWYVDFLLPNMKVVLEIDGGFHDNKKRKDLDKLKDAALIAALGPEWEVVRIKEELLKQNLKRLVPAIKAVIDGRKRVRSSHDGQLPKTYSNTTI